MLFSYCRTSIAITSVILFLYVTYRLIITFKRHKIRNIIAGSIFYLSILTLIAFNIASYATRGSFAPMMYKHIEWFFNTRTLDKRKYIWGNIQLELKGGWLILGRGFGTHNYMLYPMNLLNNDNVCPSHSTYYAILGAGGLISLFAFFGLIAYYIVIFIKCFKVSKTMPIGLSFGILGFLAYSFTEGVNYLIVASTFPLILYYNIYRKNMPKDNN